MSYISHAVTDRLHEWITLKCVSNRDTSYELNSLSIWWKVFLIPCCRNLREDQLIMKSQCCLTFSFRNSDPGQRPLSSWTITHHSEQEVQGTWIMPHSKGRVCFPKLTNSHMPPCLPVVAELQQANYFRRLLFCSTAGSLTAAHQFLAVGIMATWLVLPANVSPQHSNSNPQTTTMKQKVQKLT